MNTHIKLSLIIAVFLILVGGILFGLVMSVLKWDFSKLSTVKFQTNTHTVSEAFSDLSVNSTTADILLVASETAQCTVECVEQEHLTHTVAVENGTLTIDVKDTRRWYHRVGICFQKPTVIVKIPVGEYGALSLNIDTGNVTVRDSFQFDSIDIATKTGNVTNLASANNAIRLHTTTGNITLKNVTTDALTLQVTTGNIDVIDTTCQTLHSDGSTGDVSLRNVIASGSFTIKRSTGNICLDACDAAELTLETTTGNVTGSLLSEKIFIAETDTGRVQIPESISGGPCRIRTDTGNIRIIL